MRKFRPLIIIISIALPLVVALLYLIPKNPELGKELDFLPGLNAIINATTTFVLIAAFAAIRKKNIILHKRLMLTALGLSLLFLASYVLYHSTHESTSFGGEGVVKYIYYFTLISHILLAAVIAPLVLITLVRALSKKFDKHKKIARWTLPIWLYVTITGVIVYLMIRPYY